MSDGMEMSIIYCPVCGRRTGDDICTGPADDWTAAHEPTPTIGSPVGHWTRITRIED